MVLIVERKKGGISSSIGHVGLKIVQQIFEGESNNIVVKYGLRSLTTTPIISSSFKSPSSTPSSSSSSSSSSSIKSNNVISDSCTSVDGDYCFLRSCHLCQKPLRFDKDVYMYRGDQGFCSIECRKKQIMVDERKEMEAKYKRMVAISQMDCRGCETCKLLQELRQRRHIHTKQPHPPILSIS